MYQETQFSRRRRRRMHISAAVVWQRRGVSDAGCPHSNPSHSRASKAIPKVRSERISNAAAETESDSSATQTHTRGKTACHSKRNGEKRTKHSGIASYTPRQAVTRTPPHWLSTVSSSFYILFSLHDSPTLFLLLFLHNNNNKIEQVFRSRGWWRRY